MSEKDEMDLKMILIFSDVHPITQDCDCTNDTGHLKWLRF